MNNEEVNKIIDLMRAHKIRVKNHLVRFNRCLLDGDRDTFDELQKENEPIRAASDFITRKAVAVLGVDEYNKINDKLNKEVGLT